MTAAVYNKVLVSKHCYCKHFLQLDVNHNSSSMMQMQGCTMPVSVHIPVSCEVSVVTNKPISTVREMYAAFVPAGK